MSIKLTCARPFMPLIESRGSGGIEFVFHMLDTTVVNAFVIYSHITDGKKLSLKEFRVAVARGIIGIPIR